MITVENYSDRHFLQVMGLIESFHKESVYEYDRDFDFKSVIETIQNANAEDCFLMLDSGGICRGILYGLRVQSKLNKGIIFQEVIWYVDPDHRKYGGELLRQVQKILKSEGVSSMIMVALENSMSSALDRFYTRNGYEKMETHYMRTL